MVVNTLKFKGAITWGQAKCIGTSKARKVLLREVMREGLPGRSCVSPSHVSGNSTAGGGWWQRPSQVEETIWTKSRQGMHGECVCSM